MKQAIAKRNEIAKCNCVRLYGYSFRSVFTVLLSLRWGIEIQIVVRVLHCKCICSAARIMYYIWHLVLCTRVATMQKHRYWNFGWLWIHSELQRHSIELVACIVCYTLYAFQFIGAVYGSGSRKRYSFLLSHGLSFSVACKNLQSFSLERLTDSLARSRAIKSSRVESIRCGVCEQCCAVYTTNALLQSSAWNIKSHVFDYSNMCCVC